MAACDAVANDAIHEAEEAEGQFAAVAIFWYLVVGLWPILYFRVYL